MPPVGFERKIISAGERPQTHALDRAATGTGKTCLYSTIIHMEMLIRNSLEVLIRVLFETCE